MNTFLETIKNEILIFDGAMGTQIQNLTLTDLHFGGSDFRMLSDLLVLSKPEEIEKIHYAYFAAGAHAVETNTFGASPLRLSEYDFTKLNPSEFDTSAKHVRWAKNDFVQIAYHLNFAASQAACRARARYQKSAEYDGRNLFVAGSIGPSNYFLTSTAANLRHANYTQILDNFYQQTLGLIDGGVDVLLFETMQDPLETKAAIHGAQKALRDKKKKLPIMAQVTVDAFSKMQIFNTDILAAYTTLAGIGIDVFGINCSVGPDLMHNTLRVLSQHSRLPISVLPNAGLPVSQDGKTVFKLSPQDLAKAHVEFIDEYGVNVVGGCCGTTPAHIAAVTQAVRSLKPKSRNVTKKIFLSGPQNAVEFDSTTALVRIAERLNVRGSKKVRDAVEEATPIRFDILEDVVKEQVESLGAPIIDICMDSNIVKTEAVLSQVIQNITQDFAGAMCLDSFSVEALLLAMEVYPGRAIVNSISLEEYETGKDKIDCLVPQTLQHNPLYVALCTGPKGPGETCEQKFSLAKAIFEKCMGLGVLPEQLLFDVNAFPIGSESQSTQNFAVETLHAIAKVKTLHPDVKVSLGVGNLTTGLGKKPYMRKLLTSVFVHEARKQGLDAAIINPDHYVPVESLDVSDVELALQVIWQHDMDAYAELEKIAELKTGKVVLHKAAYHDLPLEEAVCQKIKDGHKDRKAGTIEDADFVYHYHDTIVLDVARVLQTHRPLDFINFHLMRSMKELGDGFGKGEVSLPHLLKSADIMKQAMGYIEAFMKAKSGESLKQEMTYKATVVLGTVYQDVHSIGKDLVKTLLENYGYRVIDLGVQTPLEKFVQAAIEYKAQAIGMSALLVQTSNHMITVAKMLTDVGLGHLDILIGGAPVNWKHASYVGLHGSGDATQMLPNVFYCASGMDGVNVMNQLLESDTKRQSLYADNLTKLNWHYEYAEKKQAEEEMLLKILPVRPIVPVPASERVQRYFLPKVWRPSLAELKDELDLETLFSLNWRYGRKSSWAKKGVSVESLTQQLADWLVNCDAKQWLVPHALYGVFPCRAEENQVWIYHPEDHNLQLGCLDFNLVLGGDKQDRFSVAQYFSNAKDEFDAIGLQITTSGNQVEKKIAEFKDKMDSESAYLLQGLSDRVAEDLAEVVHQKLRVELGLQERQGQRYSPGYPALKDIQMNVVLAKALGALHLLPMGLTEAGEFTPTGTTGAVVCFHPNASYE